MWKRIDCGRGSIVAIRTQIIVRIIAFPFTVYLFLVSASFDLNLDAVSIFLSGAFWRGRRLDMNAPPITSLIKAVCANLVSLKKFNTLQSSMTL